MIAGVSFAGFLVLVFLYFVFKSTFGHLKDNADTFLKSSGQAIASSSEGLVDSAVALRESMRADSMESINESHKRVAKAWKDLAGESKENIEAREAAAEYMKSIR